MTIQEAIQDLRIGEQNRVAECMDTKTQIGWEHVQVNAHILYIKVGDVISTRWITTDK